MCLLLRDEQRSFLVDGESQIWVGGGGQRQAVERANFRGKPQADKFQPLAIGAGQPDLNFRPTTSQASGVLPTVKLLPPAILLWKHQKLRTLRSEHKTH